MPSVRKKRQQHSDDEISDVADELDYIFDPEYKETVRTPKKKKKGIKLIDESDRNIPYSESKAGRMFSGVSDPRQSSPNRPVH